MIRNISTSGKVIFETTLGEIDIELWSREYPKISKKFLNLCKKGYYNGKIIDKVIKDHIIVLCDVNNGNSNNFQYETNGRLNFRTRGMVGLFNNDNYAREIGSQYKIFITMNRIEEYNNKYLLFGKVVGNTIFNILNIGNVEVDNYFSPKTPIRIIKVTVLVDPFISMKLGNLEENMSSHELKKCRNENDTTRQKYILNKHLLSFEFEENEKFELIKKNCSKRFKKNDQRKAPEVNNLTFKTKNEVIDSIEEIDKIEFIEYEENQNDIDKRSNNNRKSNQMKTVQKLEEFNKKLKKLLNSQEKTWYNEGQGLNFGVDSSHAYRNSKLE